MTYAIGLRCVHCDARYPLDPMFEGCPACATDGFASGLTPTYDPGRILASAGGVPVAPGATGIWRYRDLLPVVELSHEVSLGEGGTPLVPVPRLADEVGAAELWVKDETRNPTWSFKDRHAAVTMSKALDFGARTVIVSTSGNHGAAIAAYAARAGLRCVALTYAGIPAGARAMMQAYGAEVIVTTPEGRWELMRQAVRDHGWYPAANYTNPPTNGPYGHEGYKTIAYELVDQLGGRPPDLVVIPSGYSEGLFGIWKGFDDLVRFGGKRPVPQLLATEPTAGSPLSAAFAGGRADIVRVSPKPTVARGIGVVANSYIGVAALRASEGLAVDVSEKALMEAQRDLAAEGFFAEPASATALAGLRKAARRRAIPRGLRIVIVNTSSGLKNLEPILAEHGEPEPMDPLAASVALWGTGDHDRRRGRHLGAWDPT